MEVREGRADEAETLSALVLRSKASWGYDAAFLAACAPELRIRAEEVAVRRIVVAQDARGGVLGVASLEGEPPTAALGLLFVEPAAIGRGVGRLLYREVVRRAAELGVGRLVIDADPHAAGFYRAMGAAVGDDACGVEELVRFEVAPVPLPEWARAWTGGAPAVHVGNVADFHAQFGDGEGDRERRAAADHYACLAAFCSPEPAALVLPRVVPHGWIERVGRELGWSAVEVYDGLVGPGGGGLVDALRGRPALLGRLAETGLPWVAWGWTRALGEVTGRALGEGELRYESKSAAHELFAGILARGGHPRIVLPGQWRARTRREAVRLLGARVRAGEATVVKTEHGVGGSGTFIVTPRRVREAGGVRAVLRRLPRGPLLVEEYVPGPERDAAGGPRDLTCDGFVDADGRVWVVGGAVMEVRDGCYAGATVGPSVVPAWAERPLVAFGRAVGRELADSGYRGWFDVDFVADGSGRLAPTETNLRLTGPSVAFMVAARLDALRGAGHLVRIVDRVGLGARLPEAPFDDLCRELARECAGLGAVFVPAIPTGAFEPSPWLGFLVAARDPEVLDAAEALVRAGARRVGADFAGLEEDGAGSRR
ncbi:MULTISPECIES: GNAT family N-acetyltransferase [Streptomyces]|uniref:GNAT family N-acetyltransferase n=2 Tax=Streptomyces TaxID=1883 RepID=A0ABU4JZA0_9ACTN|nr:GNAT family N-acetyltransferase [Streptomyces roseolus]MDX2290823.1 GNAT family N-acetyltransferase [Streptomyces roseolus]